MAYHDWLPELDYDSLTLACMLRSANQPSLTLGFLETTRSHRLALIVNSGKHTKKTPFRRLFSFIFVAEKSQK